MRILIIEDNTFNAFCLARLFETTYTQVKVKIVNDSLSALCYLSQYEVSLIVLDGDLGANNSLKCNGPALADMIWLNHSHIPIIAWSDSEEMRLAFSEVFAQHNKEFNHYSCWPKEVSSHLILQSLPFLTNQDKFTQLADSQNKNNSVLISALAS